MLLHLRPSDDSLLVYKEVRSPRMKLLLVEHAISTGDCTLEVAHHICRYAVMLLESTERLDRVNGDWNYLDVKLAKIELVSSEVAQLGSARARKRQREESQQHISLAAK